MKSKSFRNNDKAEVGIGTMIVFIATILVAAIAAGVLINTSQKLQTKATSTGNDATNSVGSSLTVMNVYGTDANPKGSINTLDIWVQLAAGSEPIDLDNVILQYKDGTQTTNTDLALIQLDNADGTDATSTVISSGEVMRIVFTAPGSGIVPNTHVSLTLIPQQGLSTGVSFTTPLTYNDATTLTLY